MLVRALLSGDVLRLVLVRGMAWERVQNNRGRGGQQRSKLAEEVLRSLFSGSGSRSQPRHGPEWKCSSCAASNWDCRKVCWQCKKPWAPKGPTPKTKAAGGGEPNKIAALASWATPEMAQARAKELEAAVAAAQVAGCEKAVASLEADLKIQQRVVEQSKNPSLHGIESTRGYIGRQEKKREAAKSRILELEKEIESLKSEETSITVEIHETRTRLQRMETEAAKTMGVVENATSGLEDAVRMLMVAMHTCRDLPPKLAGAVEAVSKCLPIIVVSDDAGREEADMKIDGEVVDESQIPPGRIDEALGTTQPLSGKREELDRVTSDEDFLAWAKAAKRFRVGPQ